MHETEEHGKKAPQVPQQRTRTTFLRVVLRRLGHLVSAEHAIDSLPGSVSHLSRVVEIVDDAKNGNATNELIRDVNMCAQLWKTMDGQLRRRWWRLLICQNLHHTASLNHALFISGNTVNCVVLSQCHGLVIY